MPLYRQGSGGGSIPAVEPGKVLGATESGELTWMEPGSSLFRGDWGPDQLVASYDLGDGLPSPLFALSRSGSTSGTRDDVPIVVNVAEVSTNPPGSDVAPTNPPVSDMALMMRLRNYGPGLHSTAEMDLSALGIPNLSRIRFKHAATRSLSVLTPRYGTSRNGVEQLLRGPATFGWQYVDLSVASADKVTWSNYTTTGASGTVDVRYYVTDIQLYAADAPYMLGDFVTHQGKMWKSLIDNNADTPGVDASWAVALELPSPSGTTAQRPSPATAGVGYPYFDTTLNKPIWSTGSVWVDATGATV